MTNPIIIDFQSDKQLATILTNNFGSVIVLIFYSQWQPESIRLLNNINNVIPIFGTFDNVKYFSLSAQKCPQTFKKFNVQQVPFVIFTQTNKEIMYSHETHDIGQIFDNLNRISTEQKAQFIKDQAIWYPKIKSITQSSPFIVFIQGTPESPKQQSTRDLLQILRNHQIDYSYEDISENQLMRHWTKNFSKQKMFPQVFINGEFTGGLDKIKKFVERGEFVKMIPEGCKQGSPSERYSKFIQENETIVFIDGLTFENANSQTVLEQAKQKYGDNVAIYNVGIDKNMKGFMQKNISKALPFVIHKNEIATF